MNELIMLCFEFFKTGLFAVGGGFATIPFLEDMIEKYGWFTMETLSTMIAVSESTPGPVGVNMATYVGYMVDGITGSLLATLSLVAPSVIVICIIANYFQKFKNAKIVQMIFAGLKPAVVAFIAAVCVNLFVSTLFNIEESFGINMLDIKCILLFILLIVVRTKFEKIHPIAFISLSAIVGILFQF